MSKTKTKIYGLIIYLRLKYNQEFLIGRLTAEELRKEFGIHSEKEIKSLKVAGRNLLTRIPEQKSISVGLVRAAMKDSLKICIREIESLLERTPPEMQRTIKNNGIYICGGLSNMHGLSTYLSDALSLKVHTTESPEFCSANGLKKVIQSKELMKITYSMLDDNYRWMR